LKTPYTVFPDEAYNTSLRKHLHTKKISLSVNFRTYSSDPDERGIFNAFLY
jgi:hypothetical protein